MAAGRADGRRWSPGAAPASGGPSRLATEGADVAVNYRCDVESAEEVVAEIRAAGRKASPCAASVDDPEQGAAMVEGALAEPAAVDILVHSAGIASRGRGSLTPARAIRNG